MALYSNKKEWEKTRKRKRHNPPDPKHIYSELNPTEWEGQREKKTKHVQCKPCDNKLYPDCQETSAPL